MESAQAPLKINHVIHTMVINVTKSVTSKEFEWVHFDGSRESLAFPIGAYKIGDRIKITFEKVEDAKFS